MAIEIIPKKETERTLLKNILFYLAIALLVVEILGFSLLVFYQKKLEEEKGQLDTALEEKQTAEIKALERKVLKSKEKIDDFASLFNSHKKSSQFFKFLGDVTHPKVFFSGITFNVGEGKADLSGKTESFPTLGQQISILRQQKLISNINLSGISLGEEGEVDFSLNFSISPQMLK